MFSTSAVVDRKSFLMNGAAISTVEGNMEVFSIYEHFWRRTVVWAGYFVS